MAKTLKDLPVGARVRDKIGDPPHGDLVWTVAAHDHFKKGATLLVTEDTHPSYKGWDGYSWEYTFMRFSSHNISAPWETKDIRRWLRGDTVGLDPEEYPEPSFWDGLTKYFKDAVEEVTTYTAPAYGWEPQETKDTIFLLSSTELGRNAGEKDGEPIPYFLDKENRRVCRRYWTRSPDIDYLGYVAAVDCSGDFIDRYAANPSSGIRPAINLNSNALVLDVPDSDGVYILDHGFAYARLPAQEKIIADKTSCVDVLEKVLYKGTEKLDVEEIVGRSYELPVQEDIFIGETKELPISEDVMARSDLEVQEEIKHKKELPANEDIIARQTVDTVVKVRHAIFFDVQEKVKSIREAYKDIELKVKAKELLAAEEEVERRFFLDLEGTVEVPDDGSYETVIGTGTQFTEQIEPGDLIALDEKVVNDNLREVAEIISDTELQVTQSFGQPYPAGTEYFLISSGFSDKLPAEESVKGVAGDDIAVEEEVVHGDVRQLSAQEDIQAEGLPPYKCLYELEQGDIVKDPASTWEYRSGMNYEEGTAFDDRPVEWIVAAQQYPAVGVRNNYKTVLIAKDLVARYRYYGTEPDPNNFWGGSDIRQFLGSTFYDHFSDELKDSILEVEVRTGPCDGGQQETTMDKVFLPSQRELSGNFDFIQGDHGVRFNYFNNYNRDAKLGEEYENYWTRSPSSRHTHRARRTSSSAYFWNYSVYLGGAGVRPVIVVDGFTPVSEEPGEGGVYELELSQGSVSGTVEDSEGNPVEGAAIKVDGVHMATTDSGGAYTIDKLKTKEYTFQAELEGYDPSDEKQVEVVEEGVTVDFSLDGSIEPESAPTATWSGWNHADPQGFSPGQTELDNPWNGLGE